MKFSDTERVPIIPLSFENRNLSRPKEFIIDYVNFNSYIKATDGSYINICTSENTLKEIENYLLNNPNIIANIKIITEGGEKTIQENFVYLYSCLLELYTKPTKYAASSTNSGSALSAERLSNILTVKNIDDTDTVYNGSVDTNIDLNNIYNKSGGPISGDVIMKKKFIITEGEMYGTKLPETGVDGQIFILLEK